MQSLTSSAFWDLKKKHRITYDSEEKDAFIVHMDDHILKFECTTDGLYQYEVSKNYKEDITPNQTGKTTSLKTEGTSNLIVT